MVLMVEFKTKKALKEAVRDKKDFLIEDPSIMDPKLFMASELFDGQSIAVTNHPNRSWFAGLKKENGQIKVTS